MDTVRNTRDLITALLDDLERLFSDRRYKTPNHTMERIRAYAQFLPPRDAQTTEDPYPYIEAVFRFEGVPSPMDPLVVNVLLVAGIYDDGIGDFRDPPPDWKNRPQADGDEEPDPDPDGGWDNRNFGIFAVTEVLERIQEHYAKHPYLQGAYCEPSSYIEMQDEYSYPYFVGTIELFFTLPAARVEGSKYT